MKRAIQCPCGVEVKVVPSRAERTKYCSKACKYKYRKRPSGLKYNIVVDNPSWIKPGQRLSPETEFKVGKAASGTPIKPGQRLSPQTEFVPGNIPHNYKGDKVGYHALHKWVQRRRGKAQLCEFCGSKQRVQWANKSHEYKRNEEDWLSLCFKCHIEYDKGTWGSINRVFREKGRAG